MSNDASVTLPIPISRLAHRYYIYNVDHITHLRREHNIPGILVGTLPQSPQQNLFLGLPLELLSEEARLLVEKRVAYIVEDAEAHRKGLRSLSSNERRRYMRSLDVQGQEFHRAALDDAVAKKEQILDKLPESKREKLKAAIERQRQNQLPQSTCPSKETALFEATMTSPRSDIKPQPITPTLSNPPIPIPSPPFDESEYFSKCKTRPTASDYKPLEPLLPHVHSESAYAVFKHLHSQSYFLSSGLRFGAQYSVYPGDPLRFHAHFLARGYAWDEEFDLLSLVGGGRLGTGVKKGYLIGGKVLAEVQPCQNNINGSLNNATTANTESEASCFDYDKDDDETRCFCVEWAGM